MEPVADAIQPARTPGSSKQSASDGAPIRPFNPVAARTTVVEVSSSESSIVETSIGDSPVVESTASETSIRILDIIFDYALNKFSDTRQRLEAGKPKFLSIIEKFVSAGAQVETCLPAFPFKYVPSFLFSVSTRFVVVSDRREIQSAR
jgi:hypothetical protein